MPRSAGVLALMLATWLSAGCNSSGMQAQPFSPATAVVLPAPPPGDAARGMALYGARCSACHSVDENRVGPAHRQVLGRRVGTAPGFEYTRALRQSRLFWTAETLNAWLADPEQLIPGQGMDYQVENSKDRADLIAYLAQLK